MPTNSDNETKADPLNLHDTANEVGGVYYYELPYDEEALNQITFYETAAVVGASSDEQLTPTSEEFVENMNIVFAYDVPDPVNDEERAINYDPTDDEALLLRIDESVMSMIIMADEHVPPSYTEEDPTLEMDDVQDTLTNEIENNELGEQEQPVPAELTRGQKLVGLARTVAKEAAPVAIGMGVRLAVKGSLAGVVGGPVLAGLAGGLGTAARTAASLQSGDTERNLYVSEDIDKSSVSDIHERYVMKQKRRAEKDGKINKVLSIINAPERWAVERVYKAEEREKLIDEQLMTLGIAIKPDEQGRAYYETTDGRKLSEIFEQANTRSDPDEQSQLDILIQRMAVQARLTKHSTSTMEGMRDVKKDLFLQACVIRGEDSIEALHDTLEAAKNEFAAKEKLATVGMIAGISAAKSAFKGAIGVALAEGVMGANIEDALENGIEYVGDKFEYVSETLQEKTEQLVSLLGQLKESGARLINELTSREEVRKGLKQAVQLTRELKGVQVVQESLGNAQTLIAETARSLEIETLDVEIPSGSTVGEELLTSLQSNGEGLNIWNEDSAELWGAMILENQDDGFFTDALKMAESVGDEEWIRFAHEMGLNESTGHFDQATIMSLVEKANSGDRAAFQKLYRMFHWVRAGDTIKIPTNIQALMENGLTNFESASTLVPDTEEVTSIISETPNIAEVTSSVTETAAVIQDSSQLETEIFLATMAQADTKTQELMESIKRLSGSEDPVADLLAKLEESGDRIGDLERFIGPVAEKIEELTEEIENTYQELGGIETLANAYFRVRGLIENEPELIEKLSELEETTEDPITAAVNSSNDNLLPYLGLAVAGTRLHRWNRNRRSKNSASTRTAHNTASQTITTPPATQQISANTLIDDIRVGTSRAVEQPEQPTSSQTNSFVPGQLDSTTFSTLGPEYDVEFTYGDTPQNTTIPELQAQASPELTHPQDYDVNILKQQERQRLADEPVVQPIEKQPPVDSLFDDEGQLEAERQKREKLAEQQRLADEAIEESYKERTRMLDEIRQKGIMPYYREVIEFKPIALDGVTTRKIPVPKVEILGTSDKMNFTDLRYNIVQEVKQEIIERLTKETPDFDPNKDKARIDSLINSAVNQKAINSRLENILSPELNMTRKEALRFPNEKRDREILLNYLKVNSSSE